MRARADIVVAGLLTLTALALRIAGMRQSLFGDELFTYADLAGRGLGGVVDQVAHGGVEDNPPLFFVLAELSSKLGDPRAWLRLPSVLLGAATVPVIYAAGRGGARSASGRRCGPRRCGR